jgi:hypothetical protein
MSEQPRMVKLTTMWERVSAKGTRYFSGFLGDAQLLMFDGGERDHPSKPGERVHVWNVLCQERDPDRRPPRRELSARGETTWQATREKLDAATNGSKEDREEHIKRLAGAFTPDTEIPF